MLDARGEAEIELPSWFDTLNTEFRYQLTCIGGYVLSIWRQEALAIIPPLRGSIHKAFCERLLGGSRMLKIATGGSIPRRSREELHALQKNGYGGDSAGVRVRRRGGN